MLSPIRAARLAAPAVLAMAAACGAGSRDLPAEPAIAFAPCRLGAPGQAARVAAECGSLDVPEDHAAPDGRTITLRVARVRGGRRSVAPDAVFLLAGGPGQAATESYVGLAGAFEPIARRRDVVLVDQRGTGGSHRLDCPSADLAPPTGGSIATASADLARRCLAALDVDPAAYTTRAAVADLEAVRAALGYASVDLVGISYGTRVAQSYARAHPERTRAMVLDGVVPQDLALGADMAAASQRALDAVFEGCAADDACRATFGDARATFGRLRTRLAAHPEVVALAHPRTAEPVTVTLDADALATTTRFMLYAPETSALLPLLYDLAERRGDARPLAAQLVTLTSDLAATIGAAMGYSVVCSEDVPFYAAAETAAANAGSYLGDLVTEAFTAVCRVWPVPPAPASFKAALASDVPALVLSGENDPVTPPAYGERVVAGLSRGRHLVAPGQAHGVLARGCVPRLAAEFIDAADAAGLDASCLAALRPAPFFLRATGPEP